MATNSRKFFCIKGIIPALVMFVVSIISTSNNSYAAVEVIPTGSKIIDMGFTPQTIANGLKPYGLVYALLKVNVPVKWIINPAKIKDGVDFTHNGVNYKGSAFIIQAPYLTAGVITLINTWIAKGVRVNTSVSNFSVDVTYTLNSAPRWVMDATTGTIAVGFLRSAEIPASAYIFKGPSQLDGCDDIYVMPHAVPTWATHKNLYYWNLYARGSIWSGCHAVSNMENSSGPDITTPATTRRMNFLMKDGPTATQNAVPFNLHNPGTPKYTLQYPTHPIMQFIGQTDNAHTWGFETVYLPYKPGGGWRPTTFIGSYDPSQQDVPGKSLGQAGIIVFGRGFGDNNRGWVLYEAGHDIAVSNGSGNGVNGPDNIAAQRAFFNFSFLSTLDKQPNITVTITSPSLVLTSGQVYNLTGVASSPVGTSLSYNWTSSCGGTFSNPTSASTTFTAPNVGSATTCTVTCKVTDNCGRASFDTKGITVIPAPRAPVCVSDIGQVPVCVGNMATIDVLANDNNPDGGPVTVTLQGTGSNGTFTNAGNGIINYVPFAGYIGNDVVTYKVTNSAGLSCTSTITVNTNLVDSHGCSSSQYWGIASNVTASSAAVAVGATPLAPSGLSSSYGDADGDTLNAATYTDFSSTLANDIIYTLSSAIPTSGTLKFYVDAATSAKSFTISESTDSITFTNPVNFAANTTDDFLEAAVKNYPVNANTKYIKISFAAAPGSVRLDAMMYSVYSCISANIVSANDAATTLEDMPVTIDVLSNDADPQNQKLTITAIVTQPTNGKVSINPDNTITYLNTRDQIGSGTDNFTYRVCNSNGLCSTASVTVNLIEDSSPAGQYKPLGASAANTYTATDTYIKENAATTNFGKAIDLKVKGKTDGTRERSLLSFNLSSPAIPANAIIDTATLSLYQIANANNANVAIYRSTRSFVDTTATWNLSAAATSWTTAGGDFDAATTWANSNVGVQLNAFKTWNLKALTQGWIKNTFANNGLIIERNPENGSAFREMRFSSNNAVSNKPSLYVSYRIPSLTNTAIPAYAPLAMPDTATTNAVTLVTINVASNDFDYNSTGLTVSLSKTTSVKGGTLSVSGSQIIYTPPTSPYYNGVDTFTYNVTSSSLTDSANVYVTVTNAPPLANKDLVTMLTNTIAIPNSTVNTVTANDSDPEGSSLGNLIITQSPTNGIATITGSDITYTPNENFIGNDTLIYRVTENSGTGCTLLSDTAIVIYTVNNRAPVAVADSDTTNPCQPKVIPVLANDSDPEDGNLTIEIVSPPALGTVALINNNSEVQFTPPPGVSNTSIPFTYRVHDNATPALYSNTVTVSVNVRPGPTNNAPVALRDTFHIFLNEPLYADVLRNDYDPDNNPFIVPLTVVTNGTQGTAVPTSNGMIQYTPNLNYFGIDSFYYQVYDDVSTSGSGCVTVQQKSGGAWVYLIIQEVPIANRDYIVVAKNTSGTVNVTANDIFGVDGPANGTIVVMTPPTKASVTVIAGSNPDQSDDLIKITPNINFVGRDSMIYQICDKTADCDTAIVYILMKGDKDLDGVPDDTDIDDDNDGIPDVIEVCGIGATSFACMPGGSDPAADDDKDGIENWRDEDFGALNSAGCVAILDTDGDGIPDFLDLDSDSDGIPDVIEAKGVDSNGDGMLDTFCDIDEDGLLQNVDSSNTGAAGSGNALGFQDFDGDGIPNSLDLDSDNDGIPDIIEANGVDANNDGMVDDKSDQDKDGIADVVDGDVDGDFYIDHLSNVLLLTSIDSQYVDCNSPGDGRPEFYPRKGNTDRTGLPDFLDLDSDGDGITDGIESGITVAAYNKGMVTGCPAMFHGWCSSIKDLPALNLLDSDFDGLFNVYDIDSDNDGITDNIEGQPTNSFVISNDTDTDDDGIADVYDIYNGIGGGGITPYDHDYDGIPDYLDTDTDNDGALDINEGDLLNASLDQFTVDFSGDADGDGLMDYFDTYDFNGPNPLFAYLNVGMSNMGSNGNFDGPTPSGSRVALVKSNPATSDRDWRNSEILPLHIFSFAAALQNKDATLTWKVENEQEVDHYIVQRSYNGVQFEQLSSVPAQNRNFATYTYSDDLGTYTHPNVYYRILQVNKKGDKSYTKIISFALDNKSALKISIYPNPVKHFLTLHVPSDKKQAADVSVSDGSGKIVIQKQVALEKGENILQLQQVAGLANGVYMIKIKAGENNFIDKLIKQ